MEITYTHKKNDGEILKLYLARITGAHEKFVFNRDFLDAFKHEGSENIEFFYDIGGHGIYEYSAKIIDKYTGEIISHERKYFMYFKRKITEIDKSDVLFALFNLNAQYRKPMDKIA